MNKAGFPTNTTVVQAEPWEKGHVARVTAFRPVMSTSKQHGTIDRCYYQR